MKHINISELSQRQKIIALSYIALIVFALGYVVGVETSKDKCFDACIEWSCDNIVALQQNCFQELDVNWTEINLTFGGIK